jgi:hypothetical protein
MNQDPELVLLWVIRSQLASAGLFPMQDVLNY